MGFLDKAKKLAEQAQEKLDDVQKDFNAKQGGGQQPAGPGSTVEYDQHGRAVQPETPQTPADLPATQSADLAQPKGDPLSAEPTAPVAEPSSGPAATPTQGDPFTSGPTADPSAPGAAPDAAPAKAEGDPLRTGEDASRHGRDADTGAAPKTPPAGGGFTSGDPLGG